MSTLYSRAVKLTIAPPVPGTFKTPKTQSAMVITDMRVVFRVIKSLRKEPNHSEITVYNLNETSRGKLQGKGARCWLEAGYASTIAQIFSGDVRYIEHRTETPDWLTRLELGDGERAYAHGRVNASFKAGTSKADILKELARQSGWDVGNIASFYADLQQQEVSGYAVNGPACHAIDRLLRGRHLTYSIQNGAIQILPTKGYLATTAVQLDADHGLIGSPEMGSPEKKGKRRVLKLRSLLQPQIWPGVRISLTSTAHKGLYVAQKVEHQGDTHGDDWFTDIEAVPA